MALSVERLQAEYDAATSPTAQAALLHEMGVLEEHLGDDAAAVREQLGALAADPTFREPLERLLAGSARRGAHKNVAKLLERLARTAVVPLEKARAELELAAVLADHDDQLEPARAWLESAARATPEDPAIWLALELLAGRTGDAALAERALGRRAELASTPELRALLFRDLSERRAEAGDAPGAFAALESALSVESRATFACLAALERIALHFERPEVALSAVEAQARWMVEAGADPARGDAVSVPRLRRDPLSVAERLLTAAMLAWDSDPERAGLLLDRALALAPGTAPLPRLRRELAERTGDGALSETLAHAELERLGDDPRAAALWIDVALRAERTGDHDAALAAIERALSLAPNGVAARVLEIELAARSGRAAELARALVAAAERFPPGRARTELLLAAADAQVRLANDPKAAAATIERALALGVPLGEVAPLWRLLSVVGADADFAERAARALFESTTDDDERAELAFELARVAARRAEPARAMADLEALSATERGAFLGRILLAYAPRTTDLKRAASADAEHAALRALIDAAEPRTARALGLAAVRRALVRGDLLRGAEELERVHAAQPSDPVAAQALATLHAETEAPIRAADVLATAAAHDDDAERIALLEIQAGLYAWRAGDQERALRAFGHAADASPSGGRPLLGLALSATSSVDPEGRRRALEALEATEPGLAQLERFALEAGRGGLPEEAERALDALREVSTGELARAAALARALYGRADASLDDRRNALETVAGWSAPAARLARAVAHRLELGGEGGTMPPDPLSTLKSASAWAEVERGAAPLLERLAAAVASRDPAEEASTRRALAERLTGSTAEIVRSSAELVAALAGLETEALATTPTTPAARLVETELAPPGENPARRARALLDAAPFFGEESASTVKALAAANQLAAGELDRAMATFREVVEAHPGEVIGWEGLRTAAIAAGDRATVAEASAALGDAVSDPELGARLWEEAATILLDELEDPMRGEFALARAAERDVRRTETFWRAFRMIRARKDHARLIALVDRRLEVVDDAHELVKLLWERARALRELGDREAALRILEQVQALDADHVGALALAGEIHLSLGRYEDAAESLAQLARHPIAPKDQRLMSGVAAADVYDVRLGQPERALALLVELEENGLFTLAVHERLARAAVGASDYERAVRVLESLMRERATASGRADAARLALVIYRDKLERPEAALAAATELLAEVPDDPDGLDLVLLRVFEPGLARTLLERGLEAILTALGKDPFDRDRIERLALVARELEHLTYRQAALGALVALGTDPALVDGELLELDRCMQHAPGTLLDADAIAALVDPADSGPVAEISALIAEGVSEAFGPNLDTLDLGRRDRVDARDGLPLYVEVAAWARALRLDEIELYVGGPDPDAALVVVRSRPTLVLGRRFVSPLSPPQRAALARALFALHRGTSVIVGRSAEEYRALFAAACRVGEVDIGGPVIPDLADLERRLARELPRKIRRALPELARRAVEEQADPVQWFEAAQGTLDRLATIAAGDASHVLAEGADRRGAATASPSHERRARRLLAFVLSERHAALRERLGMGVR
ncbi:MAG TPA: tetratricopeptide repeat protein [Polyangiaceae bacterium]|nr:tetratricopeptide repeat protein [Polyangiaceae bacterium]